MNIYLWTTLYNGLQHSWKYESGNLHTPSAWQIIFSWQNENGPWYTLQRSSNPPTFPSDTYPLEYRAKCALGSLSIGNVASNVANFKYHERKRERICSEKYFLFPSAIYVCFGPFINLGRARYSRMKRGGQFVVDEE